MSRRLPPLTSLRAFEAAGRLLSFTEAASELGVTQAAVSHQIKTLEANLDVPLFTRQPKRLQLTEAGLALLPVVSESFDRIAATLSEFQSNPGRPALTVRLSPSFAAKWLSPRLEKFRLLHADINLALFHSNAVVDFAREEIDIAVTYGNGSWPNVISSKLFALDFFPVCSPALLKGHKPLLRPEDLQEQTLLHDTNRQTWRDWLNMAGLSKIDASRGILIDDTNVLIQAAIDGQGVALGSSAFVGDTLATGKLVKPFDLVLENEFSYYVVCPEEHLKQASVKVFKDWLLAEAS